MSKKDDLIKILVDENKSLMAQVYSLTQAIDQRCIEAMYKDTKCCGACGAFDRYNCLCLYPKSGYYACFVAPEDGCSKWISKEDYIKYKESGDE